MKYEELLERGIKRLPESAIEKQRFEIPKALGHIEGNKTVVSNFFQIADALGRNPEHLLKFLLRELATPGETKGSLLILKRKISASVFNEKVRKYADEFVLCSECGKPDTQLIEEKDVVYLKCMACGTKHPVKMVGY
ncbi:MAG: translation initiation factor IF-2 subunit beta [Candidatus Woesearchaeota archaeon]|nr:translation initiation factor IF-2 subunit beta [Candidatus Woesearchaeota archaeon]